ncbi:MAG: peroxiredoxin [Verrucomicrobia bacterium]|nr:peroxiredoxin [Verrucomicrobiota bacterium]
MFNSLEPLDIGTALPSITALNQDGLLISFDEIFSQGTTLVYFYPKADTPGCTAEACSLRDGWEALRDGAGKKIQILGVSKDKPAAQKKFQQKYQLPFDLIADVDGKVAEAFCVPAIPIAGMSKRQSFLVQDGKIIWSSLKAKTKEAAEEIQKALDITAYL